MKDKLREILDTMDIPEERKTDLKWLRRNIWVRNQWHPQFIEAIDLIDNLLEVNI